MRRNGPEHRESWRFPPYYPQSDDEGVVEYYRAIGAATGARPADLQPRLVPSRARRWFSGCCDIRTLVAWKEGQGDVRRLQILMSRIGDRLCWIGGAGDDMVPAYYAAGIRAFTSSIANVSPRVARRLHDLASSGDAGIGRLMSDLIVPLYALRGRRRGYEVTVMKEMMNLMGLAGGAVRPPLPRLAPDDLAALEALVPRWRDAL